MASRDETLHELPSQTAGPYVHIGLMPNFSGIAGCWPQDLGTGGVDKRAKGERIGVVGRLIDGGGAPVRDAVVELWQADSDGVYPGGTDPRGKGDPHFSGFARSATDTPDGEFRFETVRPGVVHMADGRACAPHADLWIVARGINLGLHTRVYFPEDSAAHATDPLLARIEDPRRAAPLVA
ncbi:MAG: protocatechuate 3,4-dioxygenase subunit alpha, partial [Hyphomicrobiales bacterium]|nr:protocatechuate 3,4-dioxygenase subunit alpha [Hyphomicrobiales bacterium]